MDKRVCVSTACKGVKSCCEGLTESTHVRTKATHRCTSGRAALARSCSYRLPPRTSRWTPMGAAMLAPVTWTGELLAAPPAGGAAAPRPGGPAAAGAECACARENASGLWNQRAAPVRRPAAPPAASSLTPREAGSGRSSRSELPRPAGMEGNCQVSCWPPVFIASTFWCMET